MASPSDTRSPAGRVVTRVKQHHERVVSILQLERSNHLRLNAVFEQLVDEVVVVVDAGLVYVIHLSIRQQSSPGQRKSVVLHLIVNMAAITLIHTAVQRSGQ